MNSSVFLGDIKILNAKFGVKEAKLYLGDAIVYPTTVPITDAVVTCDDAIYNGNNQVATNIVVTLSGVTLTQDVDYVVTSNTGGTNAGSYTVSVSGINSYDETASCMFTINKVTPTVTAPTPRTVLVYDATSQQLINAASTNWGTLQYNLDGGSWTTTVPSATNANEYTIGYKVVGDSNINDVEAQSISSTINKVTPTVTPPTAKELTYNSSPQALVELGSTNFGTLKYSLDGSTYSTSVPSGTNAISYTVYYKVDGDSNINDVPAESISVTIAKADPSYTAPTAKSLTYNTSAQALLNAGSTSDGAIQYSSDNSSWSTTIPTGTNANTYTSYWRIVGDSNHNDKTSASISTTISPKTVSSPTITLSPTSYIYNGSACQPTPTVKDESVTINTSEYTISYNNNTNAGTATCVISDKSGGNYVISGSKTFTIEKVTPTVTAPTPKTLTYNTSAQVLATNGSTNWGTIQYCLDNSGGTYSTTVPSATNANVTYKVWYKVVGDSNINDVSPQSIDCMIAEKRVTTPTITLSPSSYTYSGSECKPTPTVKDGSVVIPSSEYATSYINNLNAGTATVTISDNTAGNYYISGTTTFTINKAAGSVTTKPTSKSLTYNNTSQQLVTAGSGTGTMQYKLGSGSWGTSIPTSTNAGDYTVYYKASASTNYNESASGSVSVTINKVTPTVSAPTAKSLTYNGDSQQLATAGSTNYGTLKYSLDNSTWSTAVPSGTNATAYTVYYKVDGDSNINSVASQSISVTISKANQSAPTATVTTATYPGTSTASASGGGGHGTLTWTNGNSRTAIGIQDTYAYWSGDSNYNASPNSNVVRLSVATYTPTLTLSVTNRAYNGNPLYATASVARPSGGKLIKGIIYYGTSSGARTYSVTYNSDSGSASLSSVSVTNVGSATVYAYFMPDTSCNDVYNNSGNVSKTFTVSKAAMTYTAPKAAVRTYNGSAQQIVSGQSAGGGSIYYATSSAGASSSTTVPTQTNASTTYSTWWKAVPDSNHSGGTSSWAQITGCTINKAAGSVTTKPTAKSLTWTGSAQALVNAGSGTGTMLYKLGSGSWGTSIPTATNATSYTVYYKASASTNYNESTSGSVSCSIAKAACCSTAPTAKTSLVYNASAQALVNAGSSSCGTMQYCATQTGTYSTTIPTQTNAGTYTTYWKVANDSNHSGTCSGSVSTTISCKSISIPTPTGVSRAYNGSAATATFPAATGASITKYRYSTNGSSWTETTSNPSQTNAGTLYTQAYYKYSNSNYCGEGWSSSATISISCAPQSAPTLTGATTTYPTRATATASGGGGHGALFWSNGDSRSTCGSQTTKAYWGGDGNYCSSSWSNEVTLTVNKGAPPSYTAPTAKTGLVYNGSSQTLYNAGSSSYGSFSYSNGTRTAAGSQTVSWTFTPTDSCRNGASGSFTGSISKASQTISFDSSTASVNVGISLTKTATRSVGDGTVTYSSSNTSIATVNSSTGVVTGVATGTCTITATAAATTNYNSASAQYELSVEAAGTTVTLGFSYQGHTMFLIVGKFSTQNYPQGYQFTKNGQTYEFAASTSAGATWSFTVTQALYTQNGTSYNLTCNRPAGATITGTGSKRISFSYSAANKTWNAYLE